MEEVIISDSLVNNYSLYAIVTIFTIGIILGIIAGMILRINTGNDS